MVDIQKVKLIIWDMDDTFWNGTLSEGEVVIDDKNIQLLKELCQKGIMNSICSKNNYDDVRKVLEKYDIWKYFVFPSINWSAKGARVRKIIDNMKLRATNVLFIDDNVMNLKEVKYCCPDIMTETPQCIEELRKLLPEVRKNDQSLSRLEQYKLLENKRKDEEIIGDNLEFLMQSNIHVEINGNVMSYLTRIHELILRTNQLNYTKKRITLDQLTLICKDETYNCGCVNAQDRYGDYGLIGFFACKNNHLEHFLFSCRTMGMGIEQYVYNYLGCPELNVVGDVAYLVEKDKRVEWINSNNEIVRDTKKREVNIKILAKGPCDMQQVFSYINIDDNNLMQEYSFVEPQNGVYIESHNSTTNIIESVELSDVEKNKVIVEVPFSSPKLYYTSMFSEKYDIVFYSLFTDCGHGIYKRRNGGQKVSFGEYKYDLTKEENWKSFIEGDIFNANMKLEIEELKKFRDFYEYCGRITNKELMQNLDYIRNRLPNDTFLVLFLGSELEYKSNKQPAYVDRHQIHRQINSLVREWAKGKRNVGIIDFNKYIDSQSDYYNNINHFVKSVYYQASRDVADFINEIASQNLVSQKSILTLYSSVLIQKIFTPIRNKCSLIKRWFRRRLKKRCL